MYTFVVHTNPTVRGAMMMSPSDRMGLLNENRPNHKVVHNPSIFRPSTYSLSIN